MKNEFIIDTNPDVEIVFNNYPDFVRPQLIYLRQLILETAEETEGITQVQETLKWGEPSYLVKKGSTLRIDWKAKKPEQYAIYFKCTSLLVPTFKTLFSDIFEFESNRAIIFKLEDVLPEPELKQCIQATLTYHWVKHLPSLGMKGT